MKRSGPFLLFGGRLSDVISRQQAAGDDSFVPRVIRDCTSFLKEQCTEMDISMTICRGRSDLAYYIASYNDGNPVLFEKSTDPRAVAGILKSYVQFMPEPLIPIVLQSRLNSWNLDNREPIDKFVDIFIRIPHPFKDTLLHLLSFFQGIIQKVPPERIDATSLAHVYGPLFFGQHLRSARLMTYEPSLSIEITVMLIKDYKKLKDLPCHDDAAVVLESLINEPEDSPEKIEEMKQTIVRLEQQSVHHRAIIKQLHLQINSLISKEIGEDEDETAPISQEKGTYDSMMTDTNDQNELVERLRREVQRNETLLSVITKLREGFASLIKHLQEKMKERLELKEKDHEDGKIGIIEGYNAAATEELEKEQRDNPCEIEPNVSIDSSGELLLSPHPETAENQVTNGDHKDSNIQAMDKDEAIFDEITNPYIQFLLESVQTLQHIVAEPCDGSSSPTQGESGRPSKSRAMEISAVPRLTSVNRNDAYHADIEQLRSSTEERIQKIMAEYEKSVSLSTQMLEEKDSSIVELQDKLIQINKVTCSTLSKMKESKLPEIYIGKLSENDDPLSMSIYLGEMVYRLSYQLSIYRARFEDKMDVSTQTTEKESATDEQNQNLMQTISEPPTQTPKVSDSVPIIPEEAPDSRKTETDATNSSQIDTNSSLQNTPRLQEAGSKQNSVYNSFSESASTQQDVRSDSIQSATNKPSHFQPNTSFSALPLEQARQQQLELLQTQLASTRRMLSLQHEFIVKAKKQEQERLNGIRGLVESIEIDVLSQSGNVDSTTLNVLIGSIKARLDESDNLSQTKSDFENVPDQSGGFNPNYMEFASSSEQNFGSLARNEKLPHESSQSGSQVLSLSNVSVHQLNQVGSLSDGNRSGMISTDEPHGKLSGDIGYSPRMERSISQTLGYNLTDPLNIVDLQNYSKQASLPENGGISQEKSKIDEMGIWLSDLFQRVRLLHSAFIAKEKGGHIFGTEETVSQTDFKEGYFNCRRSLDHLTHEVNHFHEKIDVDGEVKGQSKTVHENGLLESDMKGNSELRQLVAMSDALTNMRHLYEMRNTQYENLTQELIRIQTQSNQVQEQILQLINKITSSFGAVTPTSSNPSEDSLKRLAGLVDELILELDNMKIRYRALEYRNSLNLYSGGNDTTILSTPTTSAMSSTTEKDSSASSTFETTPNNTTREVEDKPQVEVYPAENPGAAGFDQTKFRPVRVSPSVSRTSQIQYPFEPRTREGFGLSRTRSMHTFVYSPSTSTNATATATPLSSSSSSTTSAGIQPVSESPTNTAMRVSFQPNVLLNPSTIRTDDGGSGRKPALIRHRSVSYGVDVMPPHSLSAESTFVPISSSPRRWQNPSHMTSTTDSPADTPTGSVGLSAGSPESSAAPIY